MYDRNIFEISNGILKSYRGQYLNVNIPLGVVGIGEGAFASNQRIRSVFIPESVRRIEDLAFSHCEMLSDIKFSEGLSYIGEKSFEHCVSLQKIEIPRTVSLIDWWAFSECDNLRSVTIKGSGVCVKSSVGSHLKEVHLFGDLSKIGDTAFDSLYLVAGWMTLYVPSLSVWLTKNIFYVPCSYRRREGNESRYELYIGESLFESAVFTTNVPAHGFAYCASLKSVEFGNSVHEIGEEAFCGCNLTSVKIPDSVVVIGDGAFKQCDKLQEVTISSAYKARLYSIFGGNASDIKFHFTDKI